MQLATRSISLAWFSHVIGRAAFANDDYYTVRLGEDFLSSFSLSKQDAGPCSFPFCADGNNCAKEECSGCPFNCFRSEDTTFKCPEPSPTCKAYCKPGSMTKKCSSCLHSGLVSKGPPQRQCPIGSFRDVTDMMFSGESSEHWHEWLRPGKPHWYFSSALMADVDGDYVLDFITGMHGTDYLQPGYDAEHGPSRRIELGKTVIRKRNPDRPIHLKDAGWRIDVNDEFQGEDGYSHLMIDKHGEYIFDLDNDGVLDLLILSGGGSGKKIKVPESKDNLLFFGERTTDPETEENVTVFRGGRKQAAISGVGGRDARSRSAYLLDVNGDGLLDIFFLNARRKDNTLAPGSLYINQGDRTWMKDAAMTEYSETMILTDADGDSIAEELLVVRGLCFPLQDNPDNFNDDVKEFCSTRPIGSTAVFKFNHEAQQMQEITPKYTNIGFAESSQPQCCPLNTKQSHNHHCAPISIASGDFDGDEISDHVFLYLTKMEFFFSSDRPMGELPIEKKYVGLTIDLPQSCTQATSIRVVDMNNSGRQDIVIICGNPGSFLIYSQRKRTNNWFLRENCHGDGFLGDINRFSSYNVTAEDLQSSCENKDKHRFIEELCDEYENGDVMNPSIQGLTLADINNDGFMDAVVGARVGYQKIFLYEPTKRSSSYRHISFSLIGDGEDVNRYGIGANLILYTIDNGTQETHKQFREISSYQHTTEKYGHQDEKIIFGLNSNLSPVKLVIRWPNGEEQTLWLTQFDFTMPLYPLIDVNYLNRDKYFRIRNKKQSNSGKDLCLANVGEGTIASSKVKVVDCDKDDTNGASYFSFNEWGMLESFSEPGLCVVHRKNKNSMVLQHCETSSIALKNSWHQTQDGFLRWSASKKVLGLQKAVEGEVPYLRGMDMKYNGRKWFLDYGKRRMM